MEEAKRQSIFDFTKEMSKFQESKKEEASEADDIFSELLEGDELLDSN